MSDETFSLGMAGIGHNYCTLTDLFVSYHVITLYSVNGLSSSDIMPRYTNVAEILLELALNVSQLINQSIFIYRIENQKNMTVRTD